mmetsp:Transcript_22240/g.68465  ORF Transcript_22240/g.68465 Transcript_22240/m.68465 type:complete len:213 (+) Transcript_22240:198-836(+)
MGGPAAKRGGSNKPPGLGVARATSRSPRRRASTKRSPGGLEGALDHGRGRATGASRVASVMPTPKRARSPRRERAKARLWASAAAKELRAANQATASGGCVALKAALSSAEAPPTTKAQRPRPRAAMSAPKRCASCVAAPQRACTSTKSRSSLGMSSAWSLSLLRYRRLSGAWTTTSTFECKFACRSATRSVWTDAAASASKSAANATHGAP